MTNGIEPEATAWWEGLSESERITWGAQAARAGVSAWDLKKASIFDRGVTFGDLLAELPSNGDKDMATPLSAALDELIGLVEEMKGIAEAGESDALQTFLECAQDAHGKLAGAVTMAVLSTIQN